LAEFLQHEPCSNCGSSNAGARYTDDSFHCFACKHTLTGDGITIPQTGAEDTQTKAWTPLNGEVHALSSRGLREETCKLWGYKIAEKHDGSMVQCLDIKRNGKLIAQKLRGKGKTFSWLGDSKKPQFAGQWLWGKGKHLVITEGEIDAMSVSQAMDLKWPVVSLANGSNSVQQQISDNYDWLMGFENFVLMFDQDEPGQKAVEEACAILPVGRVKIATLPRKDANEVLLNEGPGALVRAFWDAKVWRPDGIVDGADFTMETIRKGCQKGYPFRRYPKLQEMTYGLRKGEVTLLTAGSGIGKSTLAREMAYDLHQMDGLSIGNVYLEENNVKTAQGYIALHSGVPLGKLQFNPDIITEAQWQRGLDDVIRQRMLFYDHFGSLGSANLLSKLRYMASVAKVDFIVLDHISIVTSGVESSSEGERKDIDILMTALASLTQETGVGILTIAHLKRATGKNFNEGGIPSLNDLRGSSSLEQLSDNVYSMERNQQDEEGHKNVSLLRVLKCRAVGDTGEADALEYNRATGRNDLATGFPTETKSAFSAEPTKF
jgi:twinkle protein